MSGGLLTGLRSRTRSPVGSRIIEASFVKLRSGVPTDDEMLHQAPWTPLANLPQGNDRVRAEPEPLADLTRTPGDSDGDWIARILESRRWASKRVHQR